MADDVVAELDSWIAAVPPNKHATVTLQRARDEIVALRAMREAHIRMLSAKLDEDDENMRRWIAKARNEALEEAARFIEEKQRAQRIWLPFGDEIRALKDKRDA